MMVGWRLVRYCRTNRRQGVFFIIIAIVLWGTTIFNINTSNGLLRRESDHIKSEVIKLSERYVRALARDNEGVVDGPYAGRFTAYDLKKTMAVLLENILERIDRIEKQLNITSNHTLKTENTGRDKSIQAQDLLSGKQEQCTLTEEENQLYPQCTGKIQWMKQMWKSDPCYASYGVDGSVCSFIMFLSELERGIRPKKRTKRVYVELQTRLKNLCEDRVEGRKTVAEFLRAVEGWCPRTAWHGPSVPSVEDMTNVKFANITTNMDKLMDLLVDPNERHGYSWMRMRIRRIWQRWANAIVNLSKKQDLTGRRQKKVLVHLGLLSKQSGWKFAEMQFKGGPLGELVQWSDLITTLYILGHDLTITSESDQLANIIAKFPAANSPCQSRKELPVQIIYTDIVGLKQFKKHVKNGYGKFSCLLRIVDSFGTEPAFNLRSFAKQRKKLTSWGGQDLQLQQFYTMFPHSPDNSFMGFVVEQHLNDTLAEEIQRTNIAVVYGKNDYMWQGNEEYLSTINKSDIEIHGTVYKDDKTNKLEHVPKYVINHGILNGEELHKLLRRAKIFIGLGFPYEGPAPLEAIANGAVFLNPKFAKPHNRLTDPFFKGKPTEREAMRTCIEAWMKFGQIQQPTKELAAHLASEKLMFPNSSKLICMSSLPLASQHPYAEQFIGEPFVYTLNKDDPEEVRTTVQKILDAKDFKPVLPYEYTEEGLIQRMNAYIEHQNFCRFKKQLNKWPPEASVQILFGEAGKSCKEVCWEKNLICEPSHFLRTNSQTVLKNYGASCAAKKTLTDIFYPALDTKTNDCILQQEELLFSCVGRQDNLRRLCPCRDYIKGQTALCVGCER